MTDGQVLVDRVLVVVVVHDRQAYTVDTVFIERGESARSIERPVFRQMLAYCRKHEDTIDAVVVYALTRFSRNSTDHYAIGAHLRGLGIVAFGGGGGSLSCIPTALYVAAA